MTIDDKGLRALADPERAAFLQQFFVPGRVGMVKVIGFWA